MSEIVIKKKTVANINKLAWLLSYSFGYCNKKGFRYDLSNHPQERGFYNQAEIAFQYIFGDKVLEGLLKNGGEDE